MATKDKIVNLEDLKVSHDDLDGKVSDLKSDLNNAVKYFTGSVKYEFSRGFISVIDDPIDISTVIDSDEYVHTVVPCTYGDKITITGEGGSSRAKLYAFARANGEPIDIANMNEVFVNKEMIAPANSAYLIVNTKITIDDRLVVKGENITLPTINDEVNSIQKDLTDTFTKYYTKLEPIQFIENDKYILTGLPVGTQVNMQPESSSSGFKYTIVNCTEGDAFLINGVGGGSPRLWCFINAQNRIIEVADESITEEWLIKIAPEGATRLIINSKGDTPSYTTKAINAINGSVNIKDFGAIGDGTNDDTVFFKIALKSGAKKIIIPDGTYIFSETLEIQSNTEISGNGSSSILQLANTHTLSRFLFRYLPNENSEYIYPYIVASNAENVNVNSIKIHGISQYENGRHGGISFIDSIKCCIRDVIVSDVNLNIQQPIGTDPIVSGYGISVIRSNEIAIERCNVTRCGYECIGIVDDNSDCYVRDCITSDGWRTCIQVHRGSSNILIDNCIMHQTHQNCDACFTVHGESDQKTSNIRITNCTFIMDLTCDYLYSYNAPVQLMSESEGCWFVNNKIKGGKRAAYVNSSITPFIMIGNDMSCNADSDYGLKIQSASATIIGNRLVNEAATANEISSGAINIGNVFT